MSLSYRLTQLHSVTRFVGFFAFARDVLLEQLDNGLVSCPRSGLQRIAVAAALRVDIGARVKEQPDDLLVSPRGSGLQRIAVLAALCVGIGAFEKHTGQTRQFIKR